MGNSVRSQVGWAWLLLLALLVAGPSSAVFGQAEPQLPGNVVGADSIGPTQVKQIEDYIRYWADRMAKARGPQYVAEARSKLVQPVTNPLASPEFKAAYSQSAPDILQPLVQHKNPFVRMSALIVASNLRTNKITDMAVEGLKAEGNTFAKAIRYWSAKAIADVGQGAVQGEKVFNNQQEKKILDALKSVMVSEKSDHVLEQMYLALGALTLEEASAEMMKILVQRLDQHQKTIESGLRADQKGLSNLYTRLTVDDALGRDVKARLKELTKVAAMYLQVVAAKLQKKQVDAGLVPICHDVIKTGEQILKMAIDEFDSGFSGIKPELATSLQTGNYTELLFNVQLWTGTKEQPGIVTKSKIGIPYEDVAVK